MAYAENTTVPVEKSMAEIDRLVTQYGATHFIPARMPGMTVIEWVAKGRRVRFVLPLPDRNAKEFTHARRGRSAEYHRVGPEQAYKKWEQACRSKWRSLCLSIKAKLDSVEVGIETFDVAFLAQLVDPATNKTVGEVVIPQIEKSYGGNSNRPLCLTFEMEPGKAT